MTEKADPKKTAPKKDNVKKIPAKDRAADLKTSPPKQAVAEQDNPPSWALRILIILLIFLVGAGGGLYALPLLKDRLPIVAQWIGESNNSQANILPEILPEILPGILPGILTEKIRVLEDRLATQEENIRTLQVQNQAVNQRLANISEPATSETDPALLERLDKLEQTQLDNSKREDDLSQSARIDMLLSRMSQLEASFVPLSRGLSEAQEARQERASLADHDLAQTEALNQIESRLTQVENYAARDNSGALLAFRLGELRQKITHGQAFDRELIAVEELIKQGSMANNGPISDGLSWLSRYKDGVATDARLKDQFHDLIPDLIRAKGQNKDAPWWQRAYGSAKGLIIVRETDDRNETSLDGLIAKTLDLLNRRDVQNALAIMKKLPDDVRETLTLWTLQAEIYLRAQDELDRIESLAATYYLSPEENTEGNPDKNPDKNPVKTPEKEEAAR